MTALQLGDSPGALGEGANRLGTAIARQGSPEVRLLSMNVMGGQRSGGDTGCGKVNERTMLTQNK